jgi:type III secretion protein L
MALLSWLPTGADALGSDPIGAEHGIVKAGAVQQVLCLLDAERRQIERHAALHAGAQAQAETLLVVARARADALLAQVEQRVADACHAGRADAERAAVEAWQERQLQTAETDARRVRTLHEKLAAVVTTAVERIVHTEDREVIFRRALAHVQTLAQSATALTLHVSPADAAAARASVDALPPWPDDGPAVSVMADPALAAGSCVFETDSGTLDASLYTQLQALQAVMARAVQRALAETTPPCEAAAGAGLHGAEHCP